MYTEILEILKYVLIHLQAIFEVSSANHIELLYLKPRVQFLTFSYEARRNRSQHQN